MAPYSKIYRIITYNSHLDTTVNMSGCHKSLAKFNLPNYGESSPTGKNFYIGNLCWGFVWVFYCVASFCLFVSLTDISTERTCCLERCMTYFPKEIKLTGKKEVYGIYSGKFWSCTVLISRWATFKITFDIDIKKKNDSVIITHPY